MDISYILLFFSSIATIAAIWDLEKHEIKTNTFTFPVIIEKDEDGYFVADCPDLQGCHTQGKTLEEAIASIRDAIKLHVKILQEDKEEIPQLEAVSLTSLQIAI